jgi:hypothetical protein
MGRARLSQRSCRHREREDGRKKGIGVFHRSCSSWKCRSLHEYRLADRWLFGLVYLLAKFIRQGAIESDRRANWAFVAVIELAALSINMEVVLR